MTGDDVEAKLRELGFGYRAKFISQSAKYIHEKCSSDWLNGLREIPYEEAKKELMKLMGVGAKVSQDNEKKNPYILYYKCASGQVCIILCCSN